MAAAIPLTSGYLCCIYSKRTHSMEREHILYDERIPVLYMQ
jgi:hypothetical protein